MEFPKPLLVDNEKTIQEFTLGLVYAGLSHLGEQEEAHSQLVQASLEGAKSQLEELGFDLAAQAVSVECPGVLEIPLTCKKLIDKHQVDGIVAFALVVDGGIYRHDFVAQTSLDMLMKVSLETEVPIASCILTPAESKSPERQFDFLLDHLRGKGQECAQALLQQIIQLRSI